MGWRVGLVVAAAIAVAIACGSGGGGSRDVLPPDAGTDAGVDAGTDAGVDAGTDAGMDAGTDGGTDAGPDGGTDAGPDGGVDGGYGTLAWHPGDVVSVTSNNGWRFVSDGLPGSVMGASADENGNLWVAGGSAGVFVQRSGVGGFQQYTIADGLHPYGYLPGGAPADSSPSLDATPAISIAGGPGSSAYVGYGGKAGCEDEWDRLGDNHAGTDPSIYKSGDADRVVLNGGGINVAHYDIFSGPGIVANEQAGREKLCSVYRIVWQRGSTVPLGPPGNHGYVWFGANHGFALGYADYAGSPACDGQLGCSGLLEHVHPAINDVHSWLITDLYYGIAIDSLPHTDGKGNTFFDVWFGGMARTTRFRFGEELGDYYKAEVRTELYASSSATAANIANDAPAKAAFWNRMDIWPDPVGERRDAAHGNWLSQEPDFRNPSHWVMDNVTGIAVTSTGEAWIGSSTNGLRQVDHDGNLLADATSLLTSKSIGAVAKDPSDDSVWVGYRDGAGVTRIKPDGTVLHYAKEALGSLATSGIWDIQVQPATATSKRRILVAFRRGTVGIFDAD
ncbi:MAG TPA: hypothetical protein VEP66_01985 [Myxococcales bacterium]|nr:hypothetical protein [Myxococcales bacterium]